MNKIKYCILIIFFLSSTIKPNPIAVTYFSELYFDSTGWKIEIHKNACWETDTLFGFYLLNSAGQKAFIKDSLILTCDEILGFGSYIVLTADNLDTPFEINRQKDVISLYRPDPQNNRDFHLDEIDFDLSDSIYSDLNFSICFTQNNPWSYLDFSPTVGSENDTLGAFCTVTGVVKDAVGNPVNGARIIYNWNGIAGAYVSNFTVTDSEGKFSYNWFSHHRTLIDTFAIEYPYSHSSIARFEVKTLPGKLVFFDIELYNSFPLAIGNRWDFELYSWDNGLYYDYDTVKVEVLSDTVMQNGIKYYFVKNMFFGISEYVRTDGNGIYFYLPDDSLEYFTYRYFYWLDLPYGIHPRGLEFPEVTLTNTDTASVFEQQVKTRTYDYNSGLGGFNITFAEKFGPYKGRAFADGMTVVTDSKLLGCRLSGTEYGKLTSVDFIDNIPDKYYLFQNYPNPFNPVTTIKYSIPETRNVQLKIFDIIGREVAVLVNEQKPSGVYSVNFDASHLSSGIYFYTLTAGNFVQTRKMILLR